MKTKVMEDLVGESLTQFLSCWSAGQRAKLRINCQDGKAWIQFTASLGAPRERFEDEEKPKSKSKSPSKKKRNEARMKKFLQEKDDRKQECNKESSPVSASIQTQEENRTAAARGGEPLLQTVSDSSELNHEDNVKIETTDVPAVSQEVTGDSSVDEKHSSFFERLKQAQVRLDQTSISRGQPSSMWSNHW